MVSIKIFFPQSASKITNKHDDESYCSDFICLRLIFV